MRQVEREMASEFPVPSLSVDTSVDYDSAIEEIVHFATATR
jgi:hypothetical protein